MCGPRNAADVSSREPINRHASSRRVLPRYNLIKIRLETANSNARESRPSPFLSLISRVSRRLDAPARGRGIACEPLGQLCVV
eukprot:scaffold34958_cov63-Phaeocystis_antarctica.AAC.2